MNEHEPAIRRRVRKQEALTARAAKKGSDTAMGCRTRVSRVL